MHKIDGLMFFMVIVAAQFFSCSDEKSSQKDVINDVFVEEQTKLREVIKTIINDAETANIEGLKIDIFVDVGIATYYPHVSFVRDGATIIASGRQTLVFLKTSDGWKIIHEHGTPKTR